MGNLLTTDVRPAPLVVLDVHRETFWASVRRKELATWDNLTSAILGEGRRAGVQKSAVVYDYGKAINILARSIQDSTDTVSAFAAAREFYDQNIAPVWFGEETPFFVRLHADE